MRSGLLILLLWSAQHGLPPEVIALARVKQKVEARLERLPDFTCLETIQRWTRASSDRPFRHVDTVRLEVAHFHEQEVYSWPGATSFSEDTPAEIIGSGMTSTGEFSVHLRAAFASGATNITYAGEESLGGRRVRRWDYRVAPFASNWMLRVGGATGTAVPAGSFWADAETNDLLRLEVYAEFIPPHVPLSDARARVDYARIADLGADVWLPETAELSLTTRGGEQDRNFVEFSHCRQYSGQSVVTFEEPVTAWAGVRDFHLPAGVRLALELETAVDSGSARAGDPIAARVSADARAGKTLVVPKGARVRGRVRKLEQGDNWIVGLEFDVLEFDNTRAQFYAALEKASVPGEGLSATGGEVPGVCTFSIAGPRFRLPAGTQMVWRTQDPRR